MDKVHLEHHLTLMDIVEHRGIASWRETEAEREEHHNCLWTMNDMRQQFAVYLAAFTCTKVLAAEKYTS